MTQITLAKASQNLPDLIEAALSGEEIIIISNSAFVVDSASNILETSV